MTGVGAEPIPDGEIPSVRAIRFGREHGQRRLAGSETAISGNGMQKSWLFSTYFRFFRLFPLISAEGFFFISGARLCPADQVQTLCCLKIHVHP